MTAVVAGATALWMAAAGPASAETAWATATVGGAKAVLQVDFTKLTRGDMTLHTYDTAADGAHAIARIKAINVNGGAIIGAWHTASGDGAEDVYSTYASDSAGIKYVQVEVCRVDNTTVEDCQWSQESINPYW
ncbi:hypothetical protein ACWFRM_10025 [Streptomyces sp. NPDC055144]